ncbi:MAG: hypothetical protein M0R30_07620 [Methanoregula sp.]|jgi:hypothetical protein|uniref:hypothetical protein n=1 Tax=Methanoregula sp. TaxID=2052170 RepID=UPI0025E77A50|nr:hypothetical protein [Methanoregula sp.]MCK9631497.1 hypothetical protein [Methanoregula sp.]
MKRGRPATTGINDAVAIAKKRGCVMRVTYAPDSVCDFFIRTVMLVSFVRLIRIEKIIAPASEIEHEYREIIAELRLFPQSPQIQKELWVYNKYGTYRFFRLTDAGLEEIQQSGEPVKNGEPEINAKTEGGNSPATEPVSEKDNKEVPGAPPS